MITIKINDTVYEGFTSIDCSIDVENIAGSFNFTSTFLKNNAFPISRGSKCDILVNNVVVLKGYVDEINAHYKSTNDEVIHEIRVSGRSRTADIIDSHIDGNITFKTPITLDNIIKQTLNLLNYTDYQLINNAGALSVFQTDELVAGHIGQTAFSFLSQYCSKRQVLLTSDGKGNLILTKGNGTDTNANLVNIIGGTQNNILEGDITYDDEKRFNTYIVRSQANKAAAALAGNSLTPSDISSIKGTSVDSQIRTSRLYVINESNISNSKDSLNRAQWERDMRRARALKYVTTIVGHTIIGTTQIWQPLLLVNVTDDLAEINEKLIIRKVTYELSLTEGNKTKLDLVPRDTYKLLSEKEQKQNKKKGKGSTFTLAEINKTLFGN